MSWNPTLEPHRPDLSIVDVFILRRALLSVERKMIGPFGFFDQIGPAEILTDQGIDLRPHPHIGLGTVTYLHQGEFQNRNSLGTNQMIFPGEVNWMIGGNGVTHSERTSDPTRSVGSRLFGMQTEVTLPEEHEDRALYVTSGPITVPGDSFDAA